MSVERGGGEKLAHSCQHMTKPPRTLAGTFSAEKTGEVDALGPIPNPRRSRQIFAKMLGLEVDSGGRGSSPEVGAMFV